MSHSADLPTSFRSCLSDDTLIQLVGPDRQRFLQGQLTVHMDEIASGLSRLGAVCTPKGRAYAVFRIASFGDSLLIRLPTAITDEFLQRLEKFRAFFKTTMARAPTLAAWGLVGPDASVWLASRQLLPAEVDATVSQPGIVVMRVPDARNTPRFELWGEADQLLPLLKDCPLPAADLSGWRLSDIRGGIPRLAPEGIDQFVPQMLNLDRLNGIHFKKGCYTGQEIIARMHFLGQAKRQLAHYLSETAITLAPAASLADAEGRSVGEIVSAVTRPDGRCELLAVVPTEAVNTAMPLTAGEVTFTRVDNT